MTADPQGSVTQLEGIGPKLQETLERPGIYRLLDLLYTCPLPDRSEITPLAPAAGEEAFVEGEILGSKIAFGPAKSGGADQRRSARSSPAVFHSTRPTAHLAAGTIRAFGNVAFIGRHLAIAHPEYQIFDERPPPPKPELIPVYPTTKGWVRQDCATSRPATIRWPTEAGTPFDNYSTRTGPMT